MALSVFLKQQVEQAIANGATRYSIAKEAGVDHAVLKRWLDESADIRLSTIDKLLTHFRVMLVIEPAKKRK